MLLTGSQLALQIFERNPQELCTEIIVEDDHTQNRFHYSVQDTPGALVDQQSPVGPTRHCLDGCYASRSPRVPCMFAVCGLIFICRVLGTCAILTLPALTDLTILAGFEVAHLVTTLTTALAATLALGPTAAPVRSEPLPISSTLP